MNYYPFNIGDYAAHTRGLSLMEDLAYRRLLDAYYQSEAPLTGDVARLIGMRDHPDEVAYVLETYFAKTETGWVSKRCDEIIAEYRSKAEIARENGKKGGRPKAETQQEPSRLEKETQQEPDRNPIETQWEPSGSPIETQQEPDRKLTNNQKPITKDITTTTATARASEAEHMDDLWRRDWLAELDDPLGSELRDWYHALAWPWVPRYNELASWSRAGTAEEKSGARALLSACRELTKGFPEPDDAIKQIMTEMVLNRAQVNSSRQKTWIFQLRRWCESAGRRLEGAPRNRSGQPHQFDALAALVRMEEAS